MSEHNPRPQVILWEPFTPANRPPKTTCLFSDGIATFHAGWWSTDDGGSIFVAGPTHHHRLSTAQYASMKVWARLPNLVGAGVYAYEDMELD